jgi:trigger factor
LKIETTTRDDHQVKIIVEIEPNQFESARHRAAHKIADKVKIPGFRPGKAPFDVVQRHVGDEAIKEEALELLVDETYPKAVEESGVKPAAPGTLTDMSKEEPYKFTFLVPLEPTVDLGEYKSVRQSYVAPIVTDEQVTEYVEQIRNANSVVEPAGRAAQVGDLLYLTISWKVEGDEAKDPQNAPYQVIIPTKEKQADMEWPFKGFARKFIDASEGDTKEIQHSYSDDFEDSTMKGKTVHYNVVVNSVKTFKLPELNDEFAQSLGDIQNVDDLKKRVREQLETNTKTEYDDKFFSEVVDQVISKATIKYPPQVLDDQKDDVLHSLEHDLSHQNMDLETYLKTRNLEKEAFIDKEVTPAAKKRLERSLVLNEISKAEKLELKEEELQTSFQETLMDLSQTEEFQELSKKMPQKQLANAVAMEAANRLMNRKIFDALKTIAAGSDAVETPASEAVEAPVAAAEPEKKEAKPKTRAKKVKAEEPKSEEAK